MARRPLPSRDPQPLFEPAKQLGDLLLHVRHRCDGSRVCGRARVRRPSRPSQCARVCSPQRVLRRRNRRRIADVRRRPRSHLRRHGRSTVERLGPGKHPRAGAARRATDLRLARVRPVGHPREPVAGGQPSALSRSEPVAGTQGHGAQRHRCAGCPIAPDRRAPVSAPRTPKGGDREPAEPGARRRRQSSPDDVDTNELDCP